MRMLRDWGQEQRYHHVLKGFNYRMDGIQGAILRVKLRHLEALDRGAARSVRAHYSTPAGRLDARARRRRKLPGAATSITSTPCAPRTATGCSAPCSAEGIQTGLHYPIPVHLQEAHRRPRLQAPATSRSRKRPRAKCCRCRSIPK